MRLMSLVVLLGWSVTLAGCCFSLPCSRDADCEPGKRCLMGGVCGTSTPPSGTGGNSGGGQGGGGQGGGGAAAGKRIFVTNSTYTGDLRSAGGASTGVSGGDALCNLAAQANNLGGTWVAWLSSSSQSAVSRVTSVGPWSEIVPSGTARVIFNNKANLQTTPQNPLERTESGVLLSSGTVVWTGTSSGGIASANTCGDWTVGTTGAAGNGGQTGYSTSEWTSFHGYLCDEHHHLICLEQ